MCQTRLPIIMLTGSLVPSPSTRWWQWFLLKPVEHRVALYSVEQSRNIRELFDQAVLREAAAAERLDFDDPVVAVELARAAANLYVTAILAARLSPTELSQLSAAEAWASLAKLLDGNVLPSPPAEFETARAVLSAPDQLDWSRLPVGEATRRARALLPVLRWLNRLIEPRSLSRIRYQRWSRIGALVAAAMAVSGWALNAALALPNLALHRPVQVSSVHAWSTAPVGGLVDGTIDQAYGVHTGADNPPWVMVDLGQSRKIKRVKIYNRGDGWFDDGLPLVLEFSENATEFTEVDRRTSSFGQYPAWVFVANGKSARYVRVRGKPNGFVALSELEVYGQ